MLARHQDFIPWDDDVDVMIPREDYHKLIKAIEKESHPYYKIISYETNQDFTVPLPKLVDTRTKLVQKYDIVEKVELGIYIDLFIIDGVGDSLEKGYQYYDESLELYKLWKKSALNLFPPKRSKLFGIMRWLKNIYYKCRGEQVLH
ncbi:LicD family protein [Enterococcus cecorum]